MDATCLNNTSGVTASEHANSPEMIVKTISRSCFNKPHLIAFKRPLFCLSFKKSGMKTNFNFQDAVCMFLCCLSVSYAGGALCVLQLTRHSESQRGEVYSVCCLPRQHAWTALVHQLIFPPKYPYDAQAQKCLKALKHNLCVTEQKSDSLTLCVAYHLGQITINH